MPEPTDEELLDFDSTQMANFSAEKARKSLTEQRELYRNQLMAAMWISIWADAVDEDEALGSRDQINSYVAALREVVAHLRQGDLLPGGVIYEHMWSDEGAG